MLWCAEKVCVPDHEREPVDVQHKSSARAPLYVLRKLRNAYEQC